MVVVVVGGGGGGGGLVCGQTFAICFAREVKEIGEVCDQTAS